MTTCLKHPELKTSFSEKWQVPYCIKCNKWLEWHPNCINCKTRPKRPLPSEMVEVL